MHIAETIRLHEAVKGVTESAAGDEVTLLVHHFDGRVASDDEVIGRLEDADAPAVVDGGGPQRGGGHCLQNLSSFYLTTYEGRPCLL